MLVWMWVVVMKLCPGTEFGCEQSVCSLRPRGEAARHSRRYFNWAAAWLSISVRSITFFNSRTFPERNSRLEHPGRQGRRAGGVLPVSVANDLRKWAATPEFPPVSRAKVKTPP